MNTEKTGRNDPCPCGSGKKYKQCCQRLKAAQPVAPTAPTQPNIRDGLVHHDAGRLAQAEAIYQQIALSNPGNALALLLLGVIANQQGRHAAALELIGKAIQIQPDAECHYNLGIALKGLGRHGEAIEAYQAAIALKPDFADAYNNLGTAMLESGQYVDAIASFRQALAQRPGFAEAHNNLGSVHTKRGEIDAATIQFIHALKCKPDFPDAHCNLGIALLDLGQLDAAVSHFGQAIALRPDFVLAHCRLGLTLRLQGKLYQALDSLRQTIAIQPDFAEAHGALGGVLKDQGNLEAALESYRRAVALAPGNPKGWNDLLLAMVYAESVEPAELASVSRRFGQEVAAPLRRQRVFANPRGAGRRLKIGYVSADLRQHAVSYFVEALVEQHDRSQFELYCYYCYRREDAVSERLKPHFDHWKSIANFSDDEAANLIESDQIDILVDLSGHTVGNRLLVFAKKPTPVQASWLGYPATTGMAAMDYRITDGFAEPPGMTEQYNVEALWRLPDGFCCYRAPQGSPQVAARPPMQDNGFITFGCLNNFTKVTDAVIALWARILLRTPGARLMLEIQGVAEPVYRAAVVQRFADVGVGAERLVLFPRDRANQYVLYNKIDIALDPFPCNGGTTTLDTLWMGVPLVTLAGRHFVSRMGVTLLSNAGLPELVAATEDEYADIAVALATDPAWLARIRSGLRQRVQTSPLMDAPRFARNLEHVYRAMWQAWLERTDTQQDAASQ